MLFFPPLFAGALFTPKVFPGIILPVLAFCLASSANYALNDVLDAEKDALHPAKKNRPIPAGKVSKNIALFLSGFLFLAACASAFWISWHFVVMLASYVLLMTSYSIWFKHIILLDIFCVAAGFLLRLEAGSIATAVPVSSWLFLSVFFLAVFLSIGKRLGEKLVLGDAASLHRKTLAQYPDGYLDGLMLMTGAAAMLTYALYTIGHTSLKYTVPLCCLGLFRYILRVHAGLGGDPVESLFKDMPLFVIGILWAIMIGWGIYGR